MARISAADRLIAGYVRHAGGGVDQLERRSALQGLGEKGNISLGVKTRSACRNSAPDGERADGTRGGLAFGSQLPKADDRRAAVRAPTQ